MSLLTATSITTFLICQRKFFWSFEVGLKLQKISDALRFGSGWHRSMQSRWEGKPIMEALTNGLGTASELDPIQAATLAAMLAGYCAVNGETDADVESICPEMEFRHKLTVSKSFELAGKIDGIAKLRDGRQVIWEHKTSGEDISPDSDYWLRVRFNTQLLQYVLAARRMGVVIDAAVYDVARKPCIAPKTIPDLDENGLKIVIDRMGERVFKRGGAPLETGSTENGYTVKSHLETPGEFQDRLTQDIASRPEFYFARREVPILEKELTEFETQRLVIGRQILGCRAEQKRHPQCPEMAWSRNISAMTCRLCNYQSFCLQNIEVNPDRLPTGFVIGEPNPELTNP
jgi:hypothetical protein